jgi:hypothetical protein
VGPRSGLEDVEKRKILPLPGLELCSLGRPARSQSLYRLRYPGSWKGAIGALKFYARNVDFFKINFTSRTGFLVVRYSVTNNGLPSKNSCRFQGNDFKVNRV